VEELAVRLRVLDARELDVRLRVTMAELEAELQLPNLGLQPVPQCALEVPHHPKGGKVRIRCNSVFTRIAYHAVRY
jgi:hypothetical protein